MLQANLLGVAIWLTVQKLLLLRGLPYLPLIVVTYGVGAACVAVAALASFASTPTVWTLTSSGSLALGYAILFASAMCYWLIAWASQHLDPSYVSLWQVMQPLVSGALAFAFLDERMSPREVGGGMLICLGLVVCCTSSLREGRRARTDSLVLLHHRSDCLATGEEARCEVAPSAPVLCEDGRRACASCRG